MAIAIAVLVGVIQPALADDLIVSIVSVTSSVHFGDQITLVVQTEPKASCDGTITGTTAKNYVINGKLPQQAANDEGKVTWTWTAPKQPSKLSLNISCKAGDKSGKASTAVNVQ